MFHHGITETLTDKMKRDLSAREMIEISTQSMCEKFEFISRISNNFKMRYLRQDGQYSCGHTSNQQHFLYQKPYNYSEKSFDENETSKCPPKYYPTSLRNRLLYDFISLLRCMSTAYIERMCGDWLFNERLLWEKTSPQPRIPIQRRAFHTRKVQLTSQMMADKLREEGIEEEFNMEIGQNMATENTVYKVYKEKLIAKGTMILRSFTLYGGVIVLSTNNEQGNFSPALFELVNYQQIREHDAMEFTCTCDVYKVLQDLGGEQETREYAQDSEGIVLEGGLTCIHCRFVRDMLSPACKDISLLDETQPCDYLQKFANSKKHANADIQIMSSPTANENIKLSVKGVDLSDISVVHLSACRRFFICQNTQCKMAAGYKKYIEDLDNGKALCSHLHCLNENKDAWIRLLNPEFAPTSNSVNTDDIHLSSLKVKKSNFDIKSGFWNFGGKSKYRPGRIAHSDKLLRLVSP